MIEAIGGMGGVDASVGEGNCLRSGPFDLKGRNFGSSSSTSYITYTFPKPLEATGLVISRFIMNEDGVPVEDFSALRMFSTYNGGSSASNYLTISVSGVTRTSITFKATLGKDGYYTDHILKESLTIGYLVAGFPG